MPKQEDLSFRSRDLIGIFLAAAIVTCGAVDLNRNISYPVNRYIITENEECHPDRDC